MARKNIWEQKKRWPTYVAIMAIILIIGYCGYLVYNYYSNLEEIEEFEVCYPDKCIKTYHIHTEINFDICGKNIILPPETGDLEGPHTHKQKNYIHFHGKLPYDPATGHLLEVKPLELDTTMNVMDIRFNEKCIDKYCNGDKCPDGTIGTVRMFVNGQPNAEFNKYVWKEEDEILITFN